MILLRIKNCLCTKQRKNIFTKILKPLQMVQIILHFRDSGIETLFWADCIDQIKLHGLNNASLEVALCSKILKMKFWKYIMYILKLKFRNESIKIIRNGAKSTNWHSIPVIANIPYTLITLFQWSFGNLSETVFERSKTAGWSGWWTTLPQDSRPHLNAIKNV